MKLVTSDVKPTLMTTGYDVISVNCHFPRKVTVTGMENLCKIIVTEAEGTYKMIDIGTKDSIEGGGTGTEGSCGS